MIAGGSEAVVTEWRWRLPRARALHANEKRPGRGPWDRKPTLRWQGAGALVSRVRARQGAGAASTARGGLRHVRRRLPQDRASEEGDGASEHAQRAQGRGPGADKVDTSRPTDLDAAGDVAEPVR